MPTEARLDASSLLGFLLVLARVSVMFVFVPIPGSRAVPETARVILILALTIALYPLWPRPEAAVSAGLLVLWIAVEAAFGLAAGLLVGFASEIFVFAVQAVAVQAGFSYASAIDPSSEADSGVLQIIGQLTANLFFFLFGMHAVVLRALARSLEVFPPGAAVQLPAAEVLAGAGAAMMQLGLRLSLPVAALLMLADVTLALIGRIQSQLQLLSLAFPIKMLGALAVFAALTPLMPVLYRLAMRHTTRALFELVR
ncbi:MAG: flagellar biosynthetic protein FliR [Candidatus Solibacter usitatus]|nr:flagellar biosynthetic protein FliR [Candidatus Solibacter usitatus]